MKTNKHLEEHIKRAMTDLEANFDPESWDLLAQRMDREAALEADDLIRSRMDAFEVPFVAGSWDAMEQLIQADEAAQEIENDAPVDGIAYEKLHDLQVPFSDHHWALMAKRLEEEFSLLHQLYRYKVAEIMLMALILLTIFRFFPFVDQWMHNEGEQPAKVTIPAGPAVTPGQEQQIRQIPDQGESEILPSAPVATNQGAQIPPAGSTPSLDLTGNPEPPLHQFAIPTDLAARPATIYTTKVPVLNLTAIHSLSKNAVLADRRVALQADFSRQKKNWRDAGKKLPDLLATKEPGSLASQFSWELPALNSLADEKSGELRFSIFTATDLNYVSTPPDQLNVFDTLVQTDRNFTLASGYGGGVLISLKKERMEFQTGGLYSFKRYIPNTPVFLFETLNYYIKEDFHGIQLDILQVPVNMQYHVKNTGNWRIYGTAGASGHFITSSVYEIEYERTPTYSALIPPSSPDDTRSIRQEKEFPSGLLDGGDIRDNFYLTANVGFGLERFLSPKWALFFQPNYQHYLMSDGIGTNRDKIYTLSFYLGTKLCLK